MKSFDSTKPQYIGLFKVVGILPNFLHKHWMDFTFEIIGELPNPVDHVWDKDS
jgi:hypothetical protein